LIARSLRLQERVVRLDEVLRRGPSAGTVDNQVRRDLGRIADAFAGFAK